MIDMRIQRQIAADADKFNDQLEELKTIAGQAGRSIGSELIPFISSAIKEFQLGVKHAGSFGNAVLVLGTINPFRNAQQNIRAYTDDLAKLEETRRTKPETYVSTVSSMLQRDGFNAGAAEILARLDARFAQALETGVKKATVITNALDLSLPRARKISKRK